MERPSRASSSPDSTARACLEGAFSCAAPTTKSILIISDAKSNPIGCADRTAHHRYPGPTLSPRPPASDPRVSHVLTSAAGGGARISHHYIYIHTYIYMYIYIYTHTLDLYTIGMLTHHRLDRDPEVIYVTMVISVIDLLYR